MTTKLVYVLTCAPEKHYIEQALMAVYSARHWNPEANIVLLVDDKTDGLLTGKRAEILQYVSEKKVVSFDDDSTSPMYRSRWIKTSARNLVDGDFMYVDCDTIVCRSLDDIDSFKCKVGAVWESHLRVEDFCDSLKKKVIRENEKLGIDIISEKEYYQGGVMYVKDLPETHELYEKWHANWMESQRMGLPIDEPALAKANFQTHHLIKRIPDCYNCIVFTGTPYVRDASIIHITITAYQNPCYLFTDKVLRYVKDNGLTDWVKEGILNPVDTMLPFDYAVKHSSSRERKAWVNGISHTASILNKKYPSLVSDFPMASRFRSVAIWLFSHGLYRTGALFWLSWKRCKLAGKKNVKDNICRQ